MKTFRLINRKLRAARFLCGATLLGGLLASQAFGQAGAISGRVLDETTGERVDGATVRVLGGSASARTDQEGVYRLDGLPEGEHRLRASVFGLESQTRTAVVSSGAVGTVDFRLGSDVVELEGIVVTPLEDSQIKALEQQRMSNNVGNVVSSDSMGRFPDLNVADSLGRVAGISIERDQGQARYINVRGAPAEFSTVSFDGITLRRRRAEAARPASTRFPTTLWKASK